MAAELEFEEGKITKCRSMNCMGMNQNGYWNANIGNFNLILLFNDMSVCVGVWGY